MRRTGPENTDQTWNESDLSSLLVRVDIIDINDNPPTLERHWLTDGVTKDTQFGENVLDISVSLPCTSFILMVHVP